MAEGDKLRAEQAARDSEAVAARRPPPSGRRSDPKARTAAEAELARLTELLKKQRGEEP